jgi:flagellar biosynthesis anti-sigma factor FlgM
MANWKGETNMRINLDQSTQALPESGRTRNQSAAGADNRASAASAVGEDQAQLSGTHLQVQALTAQALQLPEVRQEKVNALRQIVQDGTYKPSSNQIAGALFDHLQLRPAA